MKMLFVGDQWLGASSRGLFSGFRQCGMIVDELDPSRYVPLNGTFSARVARRVLTPLFKRSFNAALLRLAEEAQPKCVFVYKGSDVHIRTLRQLRKLGVALVLYYPDVSIYGHGRDLPQCIGEYDAVFTAKSFGVADLKQIGLSNVYSVLHGFDPEIHRKISNDHRLDEYRCDVSFIGSWTPKKETILSRLVGEMRSVDLRIMGARWQNASSKTLARHITYKEVYGDRYAAAVQAAKINLGLLIEKQPSASSGDLTTCRTFEIPACGAFMLHERTKELLGCFREGKEVACFSDPSELARQVQYYLTHEVERATIAAAGYRRCLDEHSYEHRARAILETLNKLWARNNDSVQTRQRYNRILWMREG